MKWNLEFFYTSPEDPKLAQDMEEALRLARQLEETYAPLLTNPDLSPQTVEELFQRQEAVFQAGGNAGQYVGLLFSQNTKNPVAQKKMGWLQSMEGEIKQHLAFIEPSLGAQSQQKLQQLREAIPAYAHVLEKIIEEKCHRFSVETEQVLAAKEVSGREPLYDLYEKVVSAYEYTLEVEGETKILTGDQVRNLRYHPDQATRKMAMESYFKPYRADATIIEGLYNVIEKDFDTEARLRKYPRPISMQNMDNEVSDNVVQNLIEVTSANTHLVSKYYVWKGKKMGIEISLADVYAPLKPVKTEFSFEQARKIVVESYTHFDEQAGKIVESFFEERRIDSDIASGKRGGAFCSYYTPNYKPFVLVNYSQSARDVMTLAHELGHGLHGTLSSQQTFLNYHTPLTMAEVASVFGEFLVFDQLKKGLQGEDREMLVASMLEDTFATTFRQNMFARFEVSSHDAISKEGFCSYDDLCTLYETELKGMFPSGVILPEHFRNEWASVPHFFGVPFYVYAYNFANLLVISLYEKYLEEGASFKPLYLELLQSGGKDKPERLLAKLGIDLQDPGFWQKGFDFIARMLDELVG
ncbi:MAG TPA: M3 family oligoendopeptidase [Thermotogota bacterium]|nr:M3 family oligoendopeptidase [Thermotogota bacterium]HRW91452.1 M3 family oligoendopeptidase [Thermotogota bacterium]